MAGPWPCRAVGVDITVTGELVGVFPGVFGRFRGAIGRCFPSVFGCFWGVVGRRFRPFPWLENWSSCPGVSGSLPGPGLVVYPGMSGRFRGRDWPPCPGRPDAPTNPRRGGERRPEPHGWRVRSPVELCIRYLPAAEKLPFRNHNAGQRITIPELRASVSRIGHRSTEQKRKTRPVSPGEGSETTLKRRWSTYNPRSLQLLVRAIFRHCSRSRSSPSRRHSGGMPLAPLPGRGQESPFG